MPTHGGRFETQTGTHTIQVIGTDADGMDQALCCRLPGCPTSKRAVPSLRRVHHRKQLDVKVTKRDDAVGGAMTRMTSTLQRTEAKTILEVSCTLIEVVYTYDQVVDHIAHQNNPGMSRSSHRLTTCEALSSPPHLGRSHCSGGGSIEEQRPTVPNRGLAAGRPFVKIGVLVTGDTAVRAAHSLSGHPSVNEVVVIGPASSKSFKVVHTAEGSDFLIGTGPDAPMRARSHNVPLLWDGDSEEDGVAVWGANPRGMTLALASRESDPRLVAVAHPGLDEGSDHHARFPEPLGKLGVHDATYGGQRLGEAKSPNEFAACLAIGADRRVTIIDDGAFMSGIALAAAVEIASEAPKPVWADALPYLQAAMGMGLVMAEDI